jgi:hypothetical protein
MTFIVTLAMIADRVIPRLGVDGGAEMAGNAKDP